jgi:hypothetical protein
MSSNLENRQYRSITVANGSAIAKGLIKPELCHRRFAIASNSGTDIAVHSAHHRANPHLGGRLCGSDMELTDAISILRPRHLDLDQAGIIAWG